MTDQQKNEAGDDLDHKGCNKGSSDKEENNEELDEDIKRSLKEEEGDSEQKYENMKKLGAFGMFVNFGIITRIAFRMILARLLISVESTSKYVSTQGIQTIVILKTGKLWSKSYQN